MMQAAVAVRRCPHRLSNHVRQEWPVRQFSYFSRTEEQKSIAKTPSPFRHLPPSRQFFSIPQLTAIWAAKIPRGFQDFFPTGKKYEPRTSETPEKEPKAEPDTSEERVHSKDDSQQRKEPPPPPPPDDDDLANRNLPGMLALLALIVALRQYSDADGPERGNEITYQDFRRQYLLTGKVAKLQVINQTTAKVILKKERSLSEATPELSFSPSEEMNELEDGIMTSTPASTSSTPSDTKGSSQYFYIGSVQALEEKLGKDQAHMHPQEWVEVQYIQQTNWGVELLKLAPILALGAALYFGSRGMAGAASSGRSGGIFGIGKSNAKQIKPEDVDVNFTSVAGCQEAKREIMEFVDFLKDSERFTKLGAKIPKGALLCGPPGTGKTLLAKAVAGEAGVPFFSISGSDFIEMFVGVGPSRVRDLFAQARKESPCIIFIDEIDAVGRQRGKGGFSGGNDERENTLNQLLVEMDGFSPTQGVVVLAGTNRVDILDQALTRPGRFDRQIQVDLPDLNGRKEIFQVHLKGITLEGEADEYAGRLAGLTPGFAGADIANLCNEAAIVAARRKAETVTIEDFEKATDRIIGGLESNKIMSVNERSIVAHHEAGHAVAGWFLEHADPLLKVTIIPRTSGALGFAQYLPKEVFLRSQEQIMDIVCMALAGRAAEQIFFGSVTTGASDDLRRVTQLVYSTIKDYGMNERVGQLSFPQDDNSGPGDKRYSDSTAEAMDDEARSIVDAAYQRTIELVEKHKDEVEKVALLLLEKETITHDDMVDLVGSRPFEGDSAYQEYVSHKAYKKKDATLAEEEHPPEDLQSPLTPGLA